MFNILFSHAKLRAIETTKDNAQDLARMTAFGIRAALDFRLEEEINSVLQLSAQNEEVIFLVVAENSGEVITANNLDTARLLNYSVRNTASSAFVGDSVIFIKTPVMLENKEIGQLYLGYSLMTTNLQLIELQKGIIFTSLVFIFLGFLGSLAIGRIVAIPITKLVKSFEKVSEGDLKERAEVKSSDEFGKLSESFNAMVESLEFAVSELATSNTLIRESEQLYKELVAKLPDFVILHRHQKIFLVNDAIKDVMGYDNVEVLGKNIFDFIAPESYQIVDEKNRMRLEGHEVEPYEIELITKIRK
ncbi:MAG: HAMP domain-containing protein [Ignavibacteriales bacterium]|nr:HAMP domain-containing protein [Ignavibacteriales bacterium]